MSQIDLPAGAIDATRLDAVRTLCRRHHVRRLDLFGSDGPFRSGAERFG
jgi:hypothetical protein